MTSKRSVSLALAASVVIAACSSPRRATSSRALTARGAPTFMHAGLAAGPAVFTDADGAVVEERRTEPFGLPIGAHDLARRDLTALNRRADARTGWSDHGARWLAPETGRWLASDPPVSGPDAGAMTTPWKLHPYQYANLDPVQYWDPDGRDGLPVAPNQPPVWSPPPRPLPPPAGPAAVAEVAAESRLLGAVRFIARYSPIIVVGTILFSSTDAGTGSTCGPTCVAKFAPTSGHPYREPGRTPSSPVGPQLPPDAPDWKHDYPNHVPFDQPWDTPPTIDPHDLPPRPSKWGATAPPRDLPVAESWNQSPVDDAHVDAATIRRHMDQFDAQLHRNGAR